MRLLAIVGTVALFALLGCAHMPLPTADAISGPGMPSNLHCVDYDAGGGCVLYRSAQPTAAQFSAMMAKLGLRSVVKLNTAIEGRDHLPGGVEPFEHAWSPVGPISHDDTAAALYDLEHAPRPVLIHCSHGIDRTGYLVAMWRVKHEHVLASSAWREWRSYPRMITDRLALYADFERETGYHIPEDER